MVHNTIQCCQSVVEHWSCCNQPCRSAENIERAMAFTSNLNFPSPSMNPTGRTLVQPQSHLLCRSFSFHCHYKSPFSIPVVDGFWDSPPSGRLRRPRCAAAKQPSGPVKKPPASNKKKKKASTGGGSARKSPPRDVEIDYGDDDNNASVAHSQSYQPLPKPPAGFVLDDHGRVLMASSKRIATIVDSANSYPLECIIRRVFRSSQGDECMLLCPVDTPVQILKSTNIEGWSAISDEEIEAILPTAAYALAKIHMHLVHSGFCYTARGGFCFSENDIIEFRTDDGDDVDGLPTEGIEVACFHLDGAHYMIYTPCDPLLFVAVKDQSGQLQIADDDLLEDPAITSAIDEETEFNALAEEEAALLESMLGKQ